jgi:hypothetical protein
VAKNQLDNAARLYVRTSAEIESFLDQLVVVGIHGKTRAEVAKTLISAQIERLVREGFLKLPEKR